MEKTSTHPKSFVAEIYSAEDLTCLHNSNKSEIHLPLSKREVDFSIDNRHWTKVDKSTLENTSLALAVLVLGLSILLRNRLQIPRNFQVVKTALRALCGGILFRYILQRIVMIPLFPLQSRIARHFERSWKAQYLNETREVLFNLFDSDNRYIFRDVVLEKNGVRYSGILLGHNTIINNGKWALQATGNAEPVENTIEFAANTYLGQGYNVLMINGPGVGKSEGTATPSTMGDAQEVGISYLETALKAKDIVIAGRSLGGAAIGQAILQHDFKKDGVEYTVVRQMTFDRTSNICGKTVGQLLPGLEWIVSKLVQFAGLEIDSVEASKRLENLGIKEIIVQATNCEVSEGKTPNPKDFQSDGVIEAPASLGYALVKEGVTKNKRFVCLPKEDHNTRASISAPLEFHGSRKLY